MNYYVVSEEALDAYGDACIEAGVAMYQPSENHDEQAVHKTLAICHAHPVKLTTISIPFQEDRIVWVEVEE